MIKYEGHISYTEDLSGDFCARILFGAVKFRITYSDDLDGGLYVFGLKVRTIEQVADNQYKSTSEKVASHENADAQERIDIPNESQRHDYTDIDTLKKLAKASWLRLKELKAVLSSLIKQSDSQLRHMIIDVIKKIMIQLLPRRIAGDFKFGFEDPYYTGKLLEVFAILYAKMGDDLRVEPVWGTDCFLGEIEYEGRIHLSIILWNIIKLGFNGQFRKIWRERDGK